MASPSDASRVSRWESGLQPLPSRVAATYERCSASPRGRWWPSPAGCAARSAPDPTPRDNAGDGEVSDDELDRLVDVAVRAGHGADVAPARRPLQPLRPGLPARGGLDLAVPAAGDRARVGSVGAGYVRRYEAAAAFIRHPNARRHLIMAVGRFVTDPDTQVVAPVLNLLSEVPDPAAAALTLRMLSADSDNKYLRRAASSVAAVKLARGHFDESALPRLESHVVGALRRGESLDGRLDSFDLAVRLPDSSWDRVDGALRTRRAHAP